MLADIYIPRLSNDMKLAVQKKHLGGKIFYGNPDPVKKRRLNISHTSYLLLASVTEVRCPVPINLIV